VTAARTLVIVTLAFTTACGGAAAPTPVVAAGGSYSSAHFTFHYTAADASSVTTFAGVVEGAYARILDDLGSSPMPPIAVTLYADHAALERAVAGIAGPVPSFASGLVTSQADIHMMSPNAPGWGPLPLMTSNLVHEFAHCVSLHLNPRIANNPRWLWESAAIYESGQRVDLRTIGYMAALDPPAFETLASVDNTRVYDVGYSIAEFVVARWDRGALARLIASNGDTLATLGLPIADFQRQWFAFARERYGF